MRIVWQAVRRITYEILEVKGLKIIVEVAFLQNFTIGRYPVSEIYAIEVSFRRKNFAAKWRYGAGVNVLAVHMVCPLATFVTHH